jgi:protein phosphatase PTC2/3
MGQTLSEPVTIKVSDSGEDDRYYFGVSSMQGWRVSMEDAHSAVLDMAPDSGKRVAWFAVFDGHGGILLISNSKLTLLGDRVAKYSGENVHQIVRKQEAFAKDDYVKALQDGFIGTDTALLEGVSSKLLSDFHLDRHYEDEPSGCTATAVLITEKNVLYVVCFSPLRC